MQISEQKYKRIVGYLNNELTENEIIEFEAWLNQSDENKMAFREVQRKVLHTRWALRSTLIDKQADYNKIKTQITPRVRPMYRWAAAASIIIILSLSLPLLWKSHNGVPEIEALAAIHPGEKSAELILSTGERVTLAEQGAHITESDGSLIQLDSLRGLDYKTNETTTSDEIFNTLKVARGNEYNIRLADGTKVWLNSDSELRYPVHFIGETREVYLKGEAYFEVSHNNNQQFIVHALNSEVKVFGTKFNISGYKDQGFVATTLAEGSVQVGVDENTEMLKPGYQSIIENGKKEITVRKVDPQLYMSWVNGVYEFEDMDLEYIMVQLGRWYDVEIEFHEEEYKDIRFTGAIKRDRSFGFAINLIEKVADIEFDIDENKIVIGK